MKMKSLIFLFLILIFSIGFVSASQDLSGNQTDASLDADLGEVEIDDSVSASVEEDNVLSANQTFEDIQTSINQADVNDTVTLNGNYESTGNAIDITKDLTIAGTNNAVLDGKKSSGIFNLKAKNIVLKDLTFKNAFNASAIFHDGDWDGNYSIINCTFIDNEAERAGAIFTLANRISIVNCSFENNKGIEGGAVYASSMVLDVVDSNFINNSAEAFGAIFSISNNVSMVNCLFERNTATGTTGGESSGAVSCEYHDSYNNFYSIDKCTFKDNSVVSKGNAYNAGALLTLGNTSLKNSVFSNNSASGKDAYAYASAFYHHFYPLNVSNCSFVNNYVKAISQDSSGGAIFTTSEDFYISDSTFLNNKGRCAPAINAIYATMDNCSFIGNAARYYGAVYSEYLNAVNCDFINNSADDSGGVVRAYNMILDYCTFVNNQAENAGAINGFDGVLNHCKFDGNSAQKFGSVIVIRGNMEILNSNFTNNVAGGGKNNFGWPIDIYGDGAIVLIKNRDSSFKAVNCSGIVKNTDKFKHTIKISASSVSMVYGDEKSLTAVLTGDFNNNAIAGAEVSISINGKVFKVKTNKKGKVVVSIPKLAPGKYVIKINYAGDNFNKKASKSVNLVVSKATPKLTASKKSFKVNVKSKKYSVTLKDNKNKVMKKAKLTLTVNGKTFKATTNSKGKATFKITNLNKKQAFKAAVKYSGNKYYNKISKSVKLTVK